MRASSISLAITIHSVWAPQRRKDVFEAEPGQFVGIAFLVDAKIDEHYTETVRGICQTIRRAEDFKE